VTPYLIVVHRPVGSYSASVNWLCNPAAQASAHIVTDSDRGATQLVPWDRKAWACVSFNSASYNVEVDDHAWDGSIPDGRSDHRFFV
jgi:N-acetyl-anhydromuramyl-L-alanine amidase AmpD